MLLRASVLFTLLFGAGLAAPDFSQAGFSTMDGGTTGGAGGQVVRPADLAELRKYAEDPSKPYVILVTREMNTGIAVSVDAEGAIGGSIASTYGAVIHLGSNKTLVGIGDKGFFNRVGILIQKKRNIIIRNLRFTMKDVPISKTDENKIVGLVDGKQALLGDPDCISIQADSGSASLEQKKTMESRNIWIDHCEFYNEDPAAMDEKDRYDGLLDAKNNSFNITVSWCYFHDHHKGSLIGHSDSEVFLHKITYHHNHFRNIAARQPMIRHGRAHLYNNYVHDGGGNGIDVRIGTDALIEKNQFGILSKAVFGSDGGMATVVDNVAVGNSSKKTTIAELPKGSFAPPYRYAADPVGDVISLVTANAGVGKISTAEYENAVVSLGGAATGPGRRIAARAAGGRLTIRTAAGSPIRVADLAGRVRFAGFSSGSETVVPKPLEAGVYLVRVGNAEGRVLMP